MNSTSNETLSCDVYQSGGIRISINATLILVIIIGGVGNSLLTILVLRNTEMHSIINVLLALMSVSDAALSIICAPLDLITVINHEWIFGTHMCCVHAFLLSVLVVQNVVILVIISIDRYYILIHKETHLYGCRPTWLICGCLTFSIVVSSPPLFGVGQFTFVNEHCGPFQDQGIGDVIYYGLFSSFLFVLPCGLLLLAYVHIIFTLKKKSCKILPEGHSATCNQFLKSHYDIDVRFKQKTFPTIICLYVAAMTFKLPLAITLLVKSVTRSIRCPASLRIVVLAYVNCAVNPFIYAFKISKYWMALTGKLETVKNRVNSLRSNRRSNPQNVYQISRPSTSSVI
ncbi:probable G-protein coupled receptor 45 [Argiope bruennichi]|uniref:probable G-protein coupled receptor 45 n=1 Tax=Argiope bruennichi TaxID=94029 RepID=UPI0024958787|nr:probable G-protein coupled receptor 45 [Argiope bruennichi]